MRDPELEAVPAVYMFHQKACLFFIGSLPRNQVRGQAAYKLFEVIITRRYHKVYHA